MEPDLHHAGAVHSGGEILFAAAPFKPAPVISVKPQTEKIYFILF
ncbi:hypothetical protein [Dickeya fangzhongdai]|nr:hypothetical protein [Dickeya fangzhongdai]